jgi:hypothetical protein
MLDTQAAKDYFGTSLNTNQAFIEHIYQNTLNKTMVDDPDGVAYWTGLLEDGASRGAVVAQLVGVIQDYAPGGPSYNPSDSATIAAYNRFTHRVEVSNYMADTVYGTPEDWQTSTSFSHGLVVTADPASVDNAKAAVNGLADNPVISERYNPSLELVVDDTVIDFGRLDSKRRNLGAGTALGTIPVYPWPIPSYEAVYTVYYQDESDPDLIYSSDVPVRNLCTYLDGTTYFKTLPNLLPDPDHFNPDQYPDGMTCVFAVMAAPDSHPYLIQHGSSEPMFGNGNIYTAIPVPGGVAAGTLIDNYETLKEYNTMISIYGDSGLLSVQPHIRSAGSPVELARLTAPQGVLYVIAFSDGRFPVTSGQTVTESPNPLDPLALEPSGVVVDLTVEQGAWNQGNASGYIWMSPVTDDFWDLRHSEGTGDPGLWVNGRRVATLSYVGQALPLLWEAPDNPDVPQTTHDRRHLFPDAVPAGGTVQLEATVLDLVNPDVILDTVFAGVAYPVPLPKPEEPEEGECVFTIALQDSRMQPGDPVPEVILDFCNPDTGEPSRVISYERRVENYGGYVYPYYYFKMRKWVELRTYARWEVGGGAVSGSLTSSSKQFDWSSPIPVDNPFYMAGGGYGKRYYRLSVRADAPSSFSGELYMNFYFALEESAE